jgi:hypothetical protein
VGINHPAHPNGEAPKDCIVADNVFGGATVPFHYVQGDEPVNWLWVGNRRQEG